MARDRQPGQSGPEPRDRGAGAELGTGGDNLTAATFIAVQGGNDLYWRCEAPARELGARQEIIPEDEFAKIVSEPHDKPPFRWHMQVDWPDGRKSVVKTMIGWKRMYRLWPKMDKITAIFPDHQGTAVWIRPDLARAVLAKSMRDQHGWRTISEVDDNYMMNPRLSLYLRNADWTKDKQEHHLKAIASMDAIVFSTARLLDMYLAELRDWMKVWFGQRNGASRPKLPEMYVCQNNVPDSDWPTPIPHEGKIRVGWMGSPSHVWDVDIA